MNLFIAFCLAVAPAETPSSTREGLQPLHDLIGTWRCTSTPNSSRDAQKGFWTESLDVQWQFRGKEAWLVLRFDKGKHYTHGELRHDATAKQFHLTLYTHKDEKKVFQGQLDRRVLTLSRTDGEQEHQFVLTLLHSNRFLYREEIRPAGRTFFTRLYQAGATKEGEPFAAGTGKPECIVSGGLGTSAVVYQGRTYYVCCSGCRTEFLENPEKYIKEFEEKQKGK